MPPNLPSENSEQKKSFTSRIREMADPALCIDPIALGKTFRIAILTESLALVGGHAIFISNPASSCVVTFVALTGTDGNDHTAWVREWCAKHSLAEDGKEVIITSGEEGYQQILDSSEVDAVYIALPCLQRKDFLARALKAGKHVLVDYPVCATIPEFLEVLDLAHRHGKHVQDSTMFVHHHRINEMLECVFDESFGKVRSIHETLIVNDQVPDPVTMMVNPEWREQGCVGTLARFCIMFGLIVFDRMKLKPRSVQATKAIADKGGSIEEVVCKVDFDEGRSMIIDCSLITGTSTRQVVEVESDSRTASMINFVYPQASLSSYRLYETSTTKEVVSGDAFDIEGGPPQAVMMWRRFAEMCTVIDRGETNIAEDTITIDNPREFAHVMLETLNVVTALMKSIRRSGEEVSLESIDAPAWQ